MDNKLKYISLLAGLVLFALACNTGTLLSPGEYAAFVKNPENGYLKAVQRSDLKVECLYKPNDYEALTYLGHGKLNSAMLESVKKDIAGNKYYELLIHRGKKQNESIEMYINYYLEKDLKLVFGKDTIKPNSFLVEPYNGVTPFQRVMFSFPDKYPDNENFTVLIDSTNDTSLIKTAFAYSANTINKAQVKLID